MRYLEIEGVESITAPRLKQFYDYWRSRCEGGVIPRWTDIDLMDIYPLSPYIAVKDVIDSGKEFRNRYWGTGLVMAYGFDATDKTFFDYLSPDAIEEKLALHRKILETRQPLKSSGTLVFWKNRSHIAFEGLVCPLRGQAEEVEHIVSCYDFNDT